MNIIDQIEENKQRFLKYNSIKYQRFQEFVANPTTRRVINSIPLLLSVNNKKLPGYIEEELPYGIANYAPDEDTKRFIRSKFPAVKLDFIGNSTPFIEMVAIMGSIGTIAYNKKSDFDYWVCINRKKTTPEGFDRFKQKVDTVQRWAASEIKLPVHIFINDVELVQQNIFAEDDEEALGSTVGAVLKDEFLRSSIIICGKIPFWWVVPKPVKDEEFIQIFESVPQDIRDKDFVNLGNLYKISKDDFLGAALFQIIKSLGNPFKSIIKIGVLEKYLSAKIDAPLMSQKVKENILKENYSNDILDSYLMMFKEVFDYYSSKLKDQPLLDMLKKNLYLKIDPQLSKYVGLKDNKNIPYKVVVMFQYAKEWKWNMDMITDLDNFDNWDFNKVIDFWDSVKKFMLMSYQNISVQMPTLKVQKQVSESDFLLLSRKIKTHFKREEDKIEKFITFKDTPSEPVLYIEPINEGIHAVEWRLFKRNSNEKNTFVSTTVKTEKNLLKLLVWLSLNKIYDPATSRLNIQSGYTRVNQQQVKNILNQLSEFFREDLISERNDYFLKEAFSLLNFVVINFDTENVETVQTVYHMFHSSWGESYLKEYKTDDDIAEILFLTLKDAVILKRKYEEYCMVNTPDPYKKTYKQILINFKEAYTALIEENKIDSARYITCIGNKYYVYTRSGDKTEKDVFQNILQMFLSINLKPRSHIKYNFFSGDPVFASISSLYEISKKHNLTIGYEEKGSLVLIYLINEKGNLFSFIKPQQIMEETLVCLYDFCSNIIKRIIKKDTRSDLSKANIGIYSLKTDRFGKLSVFENTDKIRSLSILKRESLFSLIASIVKHKDTNTYYNIMFPDKSASGAVITKNFGVVAKKILDTKKAGVNIQNLIKDIAFTDLKDEEAKLGSTLYFIEKYKIESIIDKFLKGI